jgi:ribosomal protein S18 acetylase RimI-like enzyme
MSAESTTTIRVADETDIPVISILAHAIWPETYGNIISKEQLNYMLDMMYSHKSLAEQFKKGHVFLMVERNAEPVAFASYSPDNISGIYRVHKLYVHPLLHGKGLGRTLLNRIIEDLEPLHAKALRLNVNKLNPAKKFYENLGFNIIYEEDLPIGEGYFMTDFVMEKNLAG